MENNYLDLVRRRVVLVHGKSDTRKGQPASRYDTTTLADIFASVDTPQNLPKFEADGFLASMHNGHLARESLEQQTHGEFVMLRVDVDEGNHDLAAIRAALVGVVPDECAVLIYATTSSMPHDRRWRVIVPIEQVLTYADWNLAQRALAERMTERGIVCDTSMQRANQYIIGPNRGEHYEYLRQHGEAFDLVTLGERMTALSRADAELAQVAAQPRERSGFIVAWNAANPLADVLELVGFETRNGRDYRHPDQTSKSYSTRTYENGRWVSMSGSLQSWGVGAVSQRGGAIYGDAWDLWVWFMYQGDMSAAVEAEAKTLAVTDAETGEVMTWEQKTRINFHEDRRAKQQLENAAMQEAEVVKLPSVMAHEEMREQFVLVADGSSVAMLSNPRTCLSVADCRNVFAPSVTAIPAGDGGVKHVSTFGLWLSDPVRHTVEKRTFAPGREMFCRDPQGHSAVNTWRRPERRPSDGNVELFLAHVRYLMPEMLDAETFLDWLAHIEQRPEVLPHYGWLHISEQTGTGRNWLASVLARVWRGQVAPNVDLPELLASPFNGQLAGRVLAVVDEIREGGGDSYRNAEKLKSLVNAETRTVNPKYGRQFLEFNACRWLIFSNHANALPVDEHDRRWRVVAVNQPARDEHVYTQLYNALNDEDFINAVGWYLANRDISGFRPGERPPMNKAKRLVIGASRSMLRETVDDLIHDEAQPDIVSNALVALYLSDNKETTLSLAMRRTMEDAGARQLLSDKGSPAMLRLTGHKQSKFWVLRNYPQWSTATLDELRDEANRVPKTKTTPKGFTPDEEI